MDYKQIFHESNFSKRGEAVRGQLAGENSEAAPRQAKAPPLLEARKKRIDFFFSSRAPNVKDEFFHLYLKSDRKEQINILIKNTVLRGSRTTVARNPYMSGYDH